VRDEANGLTRQSLYRPDYALGVGLDRENTTTLYFGKS